MGLSDVKLQTWASAMGAYPMSVGAVMLCVFSGPQTPRRWMVRGVQTSSHPFVNSGGFRSAGVRLWQHLEKRICLLDGFLCIRWMADYTSARSGQLSKRQLPPHGANLSFPSFPDKLPAATPRQRIGFTGPWRLTIIPAPRPLAGGRL